jgi:excisionase family DNA binding protein
MRLSKLYQTNETHDTKAVIIEKFIIPSEVCERFSLSRSMLSKLMAQRQIPYYKFGRSVRFRLDEITEWARKRKFP